MGSTRSMGSRDDDIGRLLGRLAGPEGAAPDVEGLYAELHALAASMMRDERRDHTLQATALVNEAFVRLGGSRNLEGADRLAFLDAAAVTMRRVLVDHARRKRADKRGGDRERLSLTGVDLVGAPDTDAEGTVDLLALQDALTEFEQVDPRAAKVVELRFFAGMTGDEIARHLDVSRNTVVRELTVARAWLKRALDRHGSS